MGGVLIWNFDGTTRVRHNFHSPVDVDHGHHLALVHGGRFKCFNPQIAVEVLPRKRRRTEGALFTTLKYMEKRRILPRARRMMYHIVVKPAHYGRINVPQGGSDAVTLARCSRYGEPSKMGDQGIGRFATFHRH